MALSVAPGRPSESERSAPDWERFLAGHFPGYLLPSAARMSVSAEVAQRFLDRFGGAASELRLVCSASLLANPEKRARLEELALRALPELVSRLPAVSEVHPRTWQGGYRGPLDAGRTLAMRAAGQRTAFVTRDRRRHFELPETVLLRWVVGALLDRLELLHHAGVMGRFGWGEPLLKVMPHLRRALLRSALTSVPVEHPTPHHVAAAKGARHRAYHLAADWYLWLDDLDRSDRARARALADSALVPLDDPSRFELAVLLRLALAVETELCRLQPGRWETEYAAVMRGRSDVVAFRRADGARLRFFYDQAELPAGIRDLAVSHYMGSSGRLRPDVTLTIERAGRPSQSLVLEVKFSRDPGYLISGFQEAVLYRHEYGPHLMAWPKAVLVALGNIPGEVRTTDEVAAVAWHGWVPAEIVGAIVRQVAAA